jgi:uncharacterized membrane protein YfcA
MAQHKAAMDRLFRTEEQSAHAQNMYSSSTKKAPAEPSGPLEAYIVENFDFLMRFLVPLKWCLIFVLMMDRAAFLGNLYITFIGIFAAILCNAVPIGGGVVYVPALALLGTNLHLGVSFSVATMTFGNGVFGFLKWTHKDPSLVIWESFVYTVLPSSLGSFLAIAFFPPMDVSTIRTIFAVFCLCLAALVLLAVYRGGAIDKIIDTPATSSATSSAPAAGCLAGTCIPEDTATSAEAQEEGNPTTAEGASSSTVPSGEQMRHAFQARQNQTVTPRSWLILATVSFLAGALLVPNIGVGPALTTFLGLQLLGYAPKRAIVTGIITGGWVSLVPFLLHLLWLNDVPLQLWVMVLPGVYFGAQVRSVAMR